MKGEGTSIGVSLLGVTIILSALLLGEIGVEFPLFSKIFLGIYGFSVMVGGAYRGSYMGGFTDIAAVLGALILMTGPPMGYVLGYEAWSSFLVGSTLLIAVPAAILAVYTFED
jgi:fructose 1,6-bisphosphatase